MPIRPNKRNIKTDLDALRPYMGGSGSSPARIGAVPLTPTEADLRYIKLDGTNEMGADLDLGSNNIVDVNLVDGVDVSAHGARHAAAGGDAVDHDALTNFVADEHIAHSGVTLTAGDGLTGGGTIAASRTFAVGAGDGIDVATDSIAVDVTDILGSGLTESSNNIDLAWGTPTIGTIQPDAAANAGTSTNPARSDHQHAIVAAIAGSIQPDDAAAEGTATSFARSDHKHSIVAAIAGSIQPDDAAAEGTATSFARSDHKHSIVAADATTLTVATVNAEGSSTSFARADHLHTITSNDNPGAAASILASSAAGHLTLVQLNTDTIADRSGGNLTVAPTGDLMLDPTGVQVRMADGVQIQSDVYTSQTTGWAISYDGSADFRNIFADTLQVETFQADNLITLAGALIITKSRARLSRAFTVPSNTNTGTLYVEDLEGYEDVAVFAANDIVRMRYLDTSGGGLIVTDVWGVVTSYTNLTGGEQSWTFTTSDDGGISGSDILVGQIALDYGQTASGSRGVWEATVLDGASGANAPYSQVQTWATNPWTPANWTTHVRLGNLRGITAVAEYGLFAGDGVTDTDAYALISDQGAEIHNLLFEVYDTSRTVFRVNPTTPSLAIGTTVPTGYLTGDGFWVGDDSGTYKMHMGDVDGEVLAWDGGTIYLGVQASEHLRLDGSTISFHNGATVRAQLNGDTWTLGNTSTEHVAISTTAVQIKDGATVYTDLTAGVLSLGNTSAEHVLVNTSGMAIKDGATTVATYHTGGIEMFANSIKVVDIDGTNGDFIFGQVATDKANLFWDQSAGRLNFRGSTAGTVVQAYVDTDGSIVAGGGVVVLDLEGVSLPSVSSVTTLSLVDDPPEALKFRGFVTPTDTIAMIWCREGPGSISTDLMFTMPLGSVGSYNFENGDVYAPNFVATGGVYVGSSAYITASYARFAGGVRIGSASDPGDDNLSVAGTATVGANYLYQLYARFAGGVRIGSVSDPGNDNLSVAGTAIIAGELRQGGVTDQGAYGIQLAGALYAGDYGVFVGGLRVGSASDPGTGNLSVAGNITESVAVFAEVGRSTTQSIANNTWTTITWNTAYEDAFSMWSSSNATRITCKKAGTYAGIATFVWDVNTTGARQARVTWNDAGTTRTLAVDSATAIGYNGHSVPFFIPNMEVNDYVYADVYQASGGSLNILNTSSTARDGCMIRMWRVA